MPGRTSFLLQLAVVVGCGGGSVDPLAGPKAAPRDAPRRVVETPPVTDEDYEARYLAARDRLTGEAPVSPGELVKAKADLLEIQNRAADPHLRANAALLLGSALEAEGERERALAHYRRAQKLIPDDAGPHMAVAVVLAALDRHAEAAKAQEEAAKLDPDNLENWLALAELRIKAGDKDGGAQAYAAYELRRKGLIDGLTLKKDGAYVSDPVMRAGCARALAAASDNGTALALLYALDSEPEAAVRAAVVETMGLHRFAGYKQPLNKALSGESDPSVRAAIEAALAEIERDPVDARPEPKAP